MDRNPAWNILFSKRMPSRKLSSYAALVDSLQICTIILEWEAILSAVLMASPTSWSGGNTYQKIIYCRGVY
jgi:hypothetical protein